MNVRVILPAVIGLLFAAGVEAEVYRWVDEKGRAHYSDRPKDGGAQKLKIKQSAPDSEAIDQQRLNTERRVQQERLLDAYREEREMRQQERVKAEAEERQRSRNCAYARNRLREYQNSRLYQPLEDGERRYLDKEERIREIERAESSVRRWCRS